MCGARSSFARPSAPRGFLSLRTMLLRHPHAAPRNALQRKMAGGGPGLAGRGPRRPAAESGGCALQASLPSHWRRACPRSSAEPRPPAPSHRHCNRRTWGGPRALLADFDGRQPEGGNALTHSASGPALVPVPVHTLPSGSPLIVS